VGAARSEISSLVGALSAADGEPAWFEGNGSAAARIAARTGGTAAKRGMGASIADGRRTSTSPSLKQKSIRSE
jgi:hypothetical protein